MAVQKPQKPLAVNNQEIYPMTSADQIVLEDGTRIGADGTVPNANALGGIQAELYKQLAAFGAADYGKVLSCNANGLIWKNPAGTAALVSVEGVAF